MPSRHPSSAPTASSRSGPGRDLPAGPWRSSRPRAPRARRSLPASRRIDRLAHPAALAQLSPGCNAQAYMTGVSGSLAGEDREDVADGELRHRGPRLACRAAEVRREQDVLELEAGRDGPRAPVRTRRARRRRSAARRAPRPAPLRRRAEPRAVLTRSADRFIRASVRLLIRCRVSGVRRRVDRDDVGGDEQLVDRATCRDRFAAKTGVMPNAGALAATARPIRPPADDAELLAAQLHAEHEVERPALPAAARGSVDRLRRRAGRCRGSAPR